MPPQSNYFLKYQKCWVLNDAKWSIYVKSRRIGITFAEAFWSVRRRLSKKIDHVFCSANLDTAGEFLRYCKQFAELFNISLQEEVIDVEGGNAKSLLFPNGSRIKIISSNPTAFRGQGGDVTLDEFAFHEHQEELYTAAQPVCQWGGVLRIISTQSSPDSVFNSLLKNEKGKFKVFRTTLLDAVEDGLAERVPGLHRLLLPDVAACRDAFIADKRDSCYTLGQYQQEYLCLFSDQKTIVTLEEYEKCIIPNYTVSRDKWGVNLSTCGPLYVGVDVGRTKNSTVIYGLEQGLDTKQKNPKLQRVYRSVLVRNLKDFPYAAQYSVIEGLINHPKVKRVVVEMNGIGAGLAEQLGTNFPGKVLPYNSDGQNKKVFIERFAGFISQERITLPSDEDVKADILGLTRIIGSSGRTSYEGHVGDSHCDSFIAGGLSLQAAEGDDVFFTHGTT